jgi:hypothetical protein
MPASGGQVNPDANVIVDWIEAVLRDETYLDTTQKLLRELAEERHVFMLSGSRTNFDADTNLQRMAERLPARRPEVPEGITHVWVASRWGNGPVGMWSAPGGWERVDYPHH